MLVHYKKLGEKSVAVCVVGYIAVLFLMNEPLKSDLSLPVYLLDALKWVAALGYFIAFWAYAKAKGRSGALGIGLSLLSIIGIIILVSLSDQSTAPPETACLKCGGKNEPYAAECRYCHASLIPPPPEASGVDV